THSLIVSASHLSPPHTFPTRRSSDLICDDLNCQGMGGVDNLTGTCATTTNTLTPFTIDNAARSYVVAVTLLDNTSAFSAVKIERSEEHTSELQSPYDLVCRLLLEKKK